MRQARRRNGISMSMTEKAERALAAIALTLAVGCTSVRISDSIEGVGGQASCVRPERKYHIETMFRRGAVAGDDRTDVRALVSRTEIDRLEDLEPDVFDRDGIPCSVAVETECESGQGALDCVWGAISCCTLCVLPAKRVMTQVHTYRIRIGKSPREGRFVLRRRYETWTSSIGLNYLMPFSGGVNAAYCWNRDDFAKTGHRAELDGMAIALTSLERALKDSSGNGSIGRQIGD